MRISVIIPTFNEAGSIKASIGSVRGEAWEIIVADGGSTDGTVGEALDLGAVVVSTPPGRGLQMDAGAHRATGDVLLFLHADTVLSEGWSYAVKKALGDERNVGGGFRLSIVNKWGTRGRIERDGKVIRSIKLKIVESIANARARYLGLIFGDQAIFARREAFFRTGGFRKLPLMEDVDCVKRLRGLGRVKLLNERASTSPRRWLENGVLRNTLRNWTLLTLYRFGVSPEKLYSIYYGEKAVGRKSKSGDVEKLLRSGGRTKGRQGGRRDKKRGRCGLNKAL